MNIFNKKNLVFVHGGSPLKKKAPCSEKTEEAYKILFEMGEERGFHCVWTGLKYLKKRGFSAYVDVYKGKWRKRRKLIKPDYIEDKSMFKFERMKLKEQMASMAPFLNPPQIHALGGDKILCSLAFPEVMLPFRLANNTAELREVLKAMKSSKRVVIKSPHGICGVGVDIVSMSKAKRMKIKKPKMVQPFIDTSKGIPGLFTGIHDIRLVFLGNKLVQAYIRTPKPGQLKANIAQGGSRIYLKLKDVPKELKKMASVFQNRFKSYANTMYSVDFLYDEKGKPKVVEINHNPTFEMTPGHEKQLRQFYTAFLDHVAKFI